VYEFGIDYRRVPHSPAFFMELSAAVGIAEPELSYPAYEEDINSRYWREPISMAAADRARGVMAKWKADGVSLKPILMRRYPLEEAASAVIGWLKDGEPVSGIEFEQNASLAGRGGSATGFVDRTGAFVSLNREGGRRNGSTVELTLDSSLQIAASQAIRMAVEKHDADSGVALIYNPHNGDLLAMANWPSYNPLASKPTGAAFNQNVMAAFEPGSTFKPLTMAAALETGAISPGYRLNVQGELEIAGHSISTTNRGPTDLRQAMAKSCNVMASKWTLATGFQRMERFLADTQMLEKPEIGLPAERRGRFRADRYARDLQLATLGFGQSIIATPVRLVAAFGILANDGKLMKPRLIRAVDGEVVPPVQEGQPISAATAQQVLRYMEAPIHDVGGTATHLLLDGYWLAGKTGTAQKSGPGGIGTGGYVSSFVGMVPARDPRVVILVMVDNPKRGYNGGTVAGPVFKSLAQRVVSHYRIPPDRADGEGDPGAPPAPELTEDPLIEPLDEDEDANQDSEDAA
jgi:cell division protein FtsI/penicillin-binding protein 2